MGSTVATTLFATYKLTPNLAPLVRLGFVQNSPSVAAGTAPPSGEWLVNPIVGVTYARPVGPLRVAGFVGVTIPVGMGGGDAPDAGAAQAVKDAPAARSAMDNAMLAVNYFTAIGGVDAAFVGPRGSRRGIRSDGLPAALGRGARMRQAGDRLGAHELDRRAGRLGYFVIPQTLAIAGELALSAVALDADAQERHDGGRGRATSRTSTRTR